MLLQEAVHTAAVGTTRGGIPPFVNFVGGGQKHDKQARRNHTNGGCRPTVPDIPYDISYRSYYRLTGHRATKDKMSKVPTSW